MAQRTLIRAPIRWHAVVVVDLDFAASVAPVEFFTSGERRRGLELLLGEIELVRAERAVVGKPCPRDGKMLLPHAEKAAEAEHGVSDIAAELIDHETLDGADLLTAGAAHRSAFDPVAGDQAVGLARRRIGLHNCLHQAWTIAGVCDSHFRQHRPENALKPAAVPIDQKSGGMTPT